MSERRDPIEAWLSADVELMPPPPGTFERVHRRARHRKSMKALTAAAGAAVVLVGGLVVPQVTGGPWTNHHPVPAKVHMTPEPRPSGQARAVAIPGPPLSPVPAGPPPAPGFQPTSVTFIGNHVGAVLGVAGSCAARPCTAMAATDDYGRTWSEIGAPPAAPADGRTGVSQVRFLDFRHGWAYGPALYATHDGGQSWRAISTHRGRVIDLSTVGDRAFAVVAFGCTGADADYATRCTRFTLFSTAASGDEWNAVGGASGVGQAVPGGLQLTSHGGFLLAGGRLYTGPVTKGAWHPVFARSTPGCIRPGASGPQLIAPTTSELFLVCQNPSTTALTLYRSPGSGSSWQRRGVVQAAGIPRSLAVSPAGSLVLATTTGIYRSADGRIWNPVLTKGGGFGFVGMTTDTRGVAVAAGLSPAVYITTDGGRTWQARLIR